MHSLCSVFVIFCLSVCSFGVLRDVNVLFKNICWYIGRPVPISRTKPSQFVFSICALGLSVCSLAFYMMPKLFKNMIQ